MAIVRGLKSGNFIVNLVAYKASVLRMFVVKIVS